MDLDSTSSPAARGAPAADWLSAWPDALALAGCLAMAWWFGWQVRDLVWSLWLSSLVVGYAMIVWKIFGPLVVLPRDAAAAGGPAGARAAGTGLYLVGCLFLLAFFTFHFGMFHFVHSVFLNLFFPVSIVPGRGFPTLSLYLHVFRDYWPFVLVAAVAERAAFRMPAAGAASVLAATAKSGGAGGGFMEPYKNVIRMHLLIFFFAFTHFAHLENFTVYAIVYAVYFFPWRLLRWRPAARV